MTENKILQQGIPISFSLNSTLEDENIRPQRNANRIRMVIISGLAIGIAMLVSFIAKLLVYLINIFTNIAFHKTLSLNYLSPADNHLGAWVIVVPAIGGIIIGLMALYGSTAIRGHGIPEAMEQILINHSRIKPAIIFLKPLSSAIAIGTGGPFGAEGPIIATGGALGSSIGQLLKITHTERKILLASGAAAGMSSIFGTPIAAIFLALELLLFEFSPRSIVPVALACITGAAGHHLLFDSGAAFVMDNIPDISDTALFTYSIMGLLFGLLSVLVTKMVYFIEDSFEKLPVHWVWCPAIGGLVVGIIGFFAPRTLGVGYENITYLLSGNVPMQLLLSLGFLKLISWSIALSSGTSGGTLAPLLTIGGAAGSLLGTVILSLFPSSGITLPLAALVGMASLFAGSSRALLTSIIFALEATLQSDALLPLLATCSASYVVSLFIMETTIMTEKISRRGVKTPVSYEPDILEKIAVHEVLKEHETVLPEDMSIKEARTLLKEYVNKNKYCIISDNQGDFIGILSATDLYNVQHNPANPIKTIAPIKNVFINANSSLHKAVELMAKESTEVLSVASKSNIIGVLTYQDILSTYKHEINEHEEKHKTISLKRRSLKILVHGKKLISRARKKSTT